MQFTTMLKNPSMILEEAGQLLLANKWQRAERLLRKLLKSDPENAEALHLAGVARHRAGKIKQARRLVERAVNREPGIATYHVTLAQILEEAGEVPAAVAAYEHAVTLDPLDAEAYFALANGWKQLGHSQAAIDCYEKALEIMPGDAPVLYNLGNTLKSLGRLEESVDCYRQALAAKPDFLSVYRNLGTTLTELGETAQGFEVLRTGARKIFAPDALNAAEMPLPMKSSIAKLTHDAEQIEYLRALSLIPDRFEQDAKVCRQLVETMSASCTATESFGISTDIRRKLAGSSNRMINLNEGARCDGPAVNPNLDSNAIERGYHNAKPEITHFDNFLTPDALQRLRTFCLESTIWYKRYENGYLGAMLGDGFASPLLAQIVDELPQMLPGIFGAHKLKQAWAFKYDSELTGINLHADFAAVNVNFWITPDDALEDDQCGGLVVWDKEAPLDWDFEKYNADETAMRQYLAQQGASAVRVPYRQNRALVFNSDLFHETDKIAFRPGYENRRINVTLLYGDRKRA